jgi:hypothetical protein
MEFGRENGRRSLPSSHDYHGLHDDSTLRDTVENGDLMIVLQSRGLEINQTNRL